MTSLDQIPKLPMSMLVSMLVTTQPLQIVLLLKGEAFKIDVQKPKSIRILQCIIYDNSYMLTREISASDDKDDHDEEENRLLW